MKQSEFDQLLAWTMLGTLQCAVMEWQRIRGRDLTDEEYAECHKQTHQNAKMLQSQLQMAREHYDK